jgi:hypothetical protein
MVVRLWHAVILGICRCVSVHAGPCMADPSPSLAHCSAHICSPALCCPVMLVVCRQVLAQLERAHTKGGACRHTLACSN